MSIEVRQSKKVIDAADAIRHGTLLHEEVVLSIL
jgi:hypothetical protein